jgi:predicted dehydrogenase
VVVSNWGPDHFETIEYVIKKGYKQIIIEKPVVCSLNELGNLVKLIKSNNIKRKKI